MRALEQISRSNLALLHLRLAETAKSRHPWNRKTWGIILAPYLLECKGKEYLFQHLGEETGSVTFLVLRHSFRCSTDHQAATSTTTFRSHVDYVISKFDDIKVMLDDKNGIAPVDKFLQYIHKDPNILKMQAGCRFIKDIKGLPRISLCEFRRQLDTLALAAGKRGRTLPELDVSQTHILQTPPPY